MKRAWVWIALLFVGALIAISLIGCSARIGPHEDGWLSWDVCGYEGGVAVEINVMAIGGRLGCTNPTESTVVDEQLPDEVAP